MRTNYDYTHAEQRKIYKEEFLNKYSDLYFFEKILEKIVNPINFILSKDTKYEYGVYSFSGAYFSAMKDISQWSFMPGVCGSECCGWRFEEFNKRFETFKKIVDERNLKYLPHERLIVVLNEIIAELKNKESNEFKNACEKLVNTPINTGEAHNSTVERIEKEKTEHELSNWFFVNGMNLFDFKGKSNVDKFLKKFNIVSFENTSENLKEQLQKQLDELKEKVENLTSGLLKHVHPVIPGQTGKAVLKTIIAIGRDETKTKLEFFKPYDNGGSFIYAYDLKENEYGIYFNVNKIEVSYLNLSIMVDDFIRYDNKLFKIKKVMGGTAAPFNLYIEAYSYLEN